MEQASNDGPAPPSRPPLNRLKELTAFASVIEFFGIPDHEQLNPRILEAIEGWRTEDEGIVTSNNGGWHSKRDLFIRQEPALKELAERLKLATVSAIKRYWPEFDPRAGRLTAEGWVNVNPKGAFNAPHAHSGHHLSGSYYVKVPERSKPWSGKIEFLTPLGAVTTQGNFGKRMIETAFSFAPQAGQLVMFPSYLPHWVQPNLEDDERVTIAFNVYVGD